MQETHQTGVGWLVAYRVSDIQLPRQADVSAEHSTVSMLHDFECNEQRARGARPRNKDAGWSRDRPDAVSAGLRIESPAQNGFDASAA